MDFNSLKSSRPIPPHLGIDDRKVQNLLRDFEKIKTSKRPIKKLKRCDLLIHSIVQILRKANSDHILYTTCIWVLVSIFRMFPVEIKELMLAAGVPGVLYHILASKILTGSMRQYTSELCYFLRFFSLNITIISNQPYPENKDVPKAGPLMKLPEVSASNRYQGQLDDVSLQSDVSSEINERKPYKKAFVPYRINDENLKKIDSLFSHGYENELAASLPNPLTMSKFGFSAKSEQEGMYSDSDESKAEEDEDASINSTLSSGTQSLTISISGSSTLSLANATKPIARTSLGNIQTNCLISSNYSSLPLQLGSKTISSSLESTGGNPLINDFKSSYQLQERLIPHYRPKTISTERAKLSNFRLGLPSNTSKSDRIYNNSATITSSVSPNPTRNSVSNYISDERSQTSQSVTSSIERDLQQSSKAVDSSYNYLSYEKQPKFIDLVHTRRLSTAPTRISSINRQPANNKQTVSDLISQLDPLSVNIGISFADFRSKKKNIRMSKVLDDRDDGTRVSDDDGDDNDDNMDDDFDLDDDETEETDIGTFDSNIVEDPDSRNNLFMRRLKMRIRAEKLIDHSFTRKLFTKKATTEQMQNLIYRMESILQLLDPDTTGFITWESFARLILAVAPSKLLRADVVSFMNAQTDDNQNLIDYKEFIISGKVTIIDKQQTKRDNLPVTGWLKRQKLYSGEESTYTWKNHVKWYQSRKAKAVVWLMRRATRSLRHATRLEESHEFLLKQSKRARAVTYLLEVGFIAVHSQDKWIDAKRNLLKRMVHARKWSQTVDSSQLWLLSTAKGVLFQMEMEDELNNSLETQSIASLDTLVQPKKKQADYATFYKVYQYYALAVTYLKNRGKHSIFHCAKQDAIQLSLQSHAKKSLMHQMAVELARSWLVSTAERAYKFCMHRDDVMKYLYRRGQFALNYLVRQDIAIPWLLNRGDAAVKFIKRKDMAGISLFETGMKTLKYLNNREHAHASLVARRKRAEIVLEKKIEAIIFLTKQPLGVWKHEDFRQNTQLELEEYGKRALEHVYRKQITFISLKHTADKATITQRRRNIAYADLLEFAQEAKISRFEMHCKISSLYSKRVAEEYQRLISIDKKNYAARQTLQKEIRWKTELLEAFNFISKATTPAIYHNEKDNVIGRIGFSKLLMNGKLFGLNKEITYDLFKFVDPASSFFVRFDIVWLWFIDRAYAFEKTLPNKKQFKFTAAEILPPSYRALVLQLKRANNETVELKYDFDWDSLAEARRIAAEDASSSEEEEEEEYIDEDILFSDPNYLKNADIGRLMRYLTKKRKLKEALEKEQQAMNSLEVIIENTNMDESNQAALPLLPSDSLESVCLDNVNFPMDNKQDIPLLVLDQTTVETETQNNQIDSNIIET